MARDPDEASKQLLWALVAAGSLVGVGVGLTSHDIAFVTLCVVVLVMALRLLAIDH